MVGKIAIFFTLFQGSIGWAASQPACPNCDSLVNEQKIVLEKIQTFLNAKSKTEDKKTRTDLIRELGRARPIAERIFQEVKDPKTKNATVRLEVATEFLAKINQHDYEKIVLEDLFEEIRPLIPRITTTAESLVKTKKISASEKESLLKTLQDLGTEVQ